MCYEQLGNILNKTEKYDPITPKLIKEQMKFDSRGVKSAADRLNWDMLGQEAQRNIDKPEEGVAKASVATGLGFATAGAGNYLQGANAASGAAGGVPAGVQGTMESALMDTGYTPSTLMNALRYGADSGQGMGQTMQNYGQGLMTRMSSPGFKQGLGKMALKQGASGLMDQQQPPPPPPPPPRYQSQPSMPIYLTEEERRRLMQQQRGIY